MSVCPCSVAATLRPPSASWSATNTLTVLSPDPVTSIGPTMIPHSSHSLLEMKHSDMTHAA
eukprot:CAMPEP_0169476664 /NCGR_PEP_ID=MMETSP1042-20121227/27495_1 /TAXON_ID=464988 /ORGANISM="Hemiselmis andersenii, Strain CCMP1180" /LENGTH=60 /DNA_ID=CAMNT_0009590945 /DNA_START=188 /DNA_END=370 /DNA_ORIENTATION=+